MRWCSALKSNTESRNVRGTPEEHNGHADDFHKLLGSVATLSRTTFLPEANSEAAVPRTSRVPIATTVAPQSCRSKNVPRTAEPALITSLTIATRFSRTLLWRDLGIRYPAGKSPSSARRVNRSEYEKLTLSSAATMRPTKAPSTRGPQTTSTPSLDRRFANSAATGCTSRGRRHNNSRSSHKSPWWPDSKRKWPFRAANRLRTSSCTISLLISPPRRLSRLQRFSQQLSSVATGRVVAKPENCEFHR